MLAIIFSTLEATEFLNKQKPNKKRIDRIQTIDSLRLGLNKQCELYALLFFYGIGKI